MAEPIYYTKIFHEKDGVREICPGVTLDCIQPGGRYGPNNETRMHTLGGQVWTDSWILGTAEDDFQLQVPDVRMPPNQYYPLHWHGCWIAVIILDGTCLIGDWWMEPGDVLISEAELEYGPVLNGPDGCQMFEIFAQAHLGLGGYAPEYMDHPTLEICKIPREMRVRSELNSRLNGRQILRNGDAVGVQTGHLDHGRVWNLGAPRDPERGAFVAFDLAAGETRAAHSYGDAHSIFVLQGDGKVGDQELKTNDVLVIERNAKVPELKAGASGMKIMDVARTVAGLDPVFA